MKRRDSPPTQPPHPSASRLRTCPGLQGLAFLGRCRDNIHPGVDILRSLSGYPRSSTHPQHFAAGEHSRTTIQGPNGVQNVPNCALTLGPVTGSMDTSIIVLALIDPDDNRIQFEWGDMASNAGASGHMNFVSGGPMKFGPLRGQTCEVKEIVQRVENKRQGRDSFG